MDHGAEDHLVVAADGAAVAARHPGLEEDRHALVVPARREAPRRRQVAVQHRHRVIGVGRDLAGEQPAEDAVLRRRLVRSHHVQQLVAHHPVDALVGGRGLVDLLERLDADRQVVDRDRRGAGVAVVVEILQQHRDPLVRLVAEQGAVEVERVLEAARQVGNDVLLLLVEVDEAHELGL